MRYRVSWYGVELLEPRLERHREQEAADQLRARERDAQLLQDVVPVAVAALVGRLVAPVRRVRIAVSRCGVARRPGRLRGCGGR